MDHFFLLIYVASLCLGCIAMYKIAQFNTISPNPLARKMIMFLILFAAGALLRLSIQYVAILHHYNDAHTVLAKILDKAFLISSSIFFFYYADLIIHVSYDTSVRSFSYLYGAFLCIAAVVTTFFNNQIIAFTGFAAIGNLLARLVIYAILGITLIRALRLQEKKSPKIIFALLYFSLETLSIVFNDILQFWKYYDAAEYFINNLIPFFFAVPFLQSLFPKPDTSIEKMKELFERYNFSERELSIIKLICDGKLNKEIAGELGIAENTVKFYIYNIYKKINVKNRVELVKHVSLTTNS